MWYREVDGRWPFKTWRAQAKHFKVGAPSKWGLAGQPSDSCTLPATHIHWSARHTIPSGNRNDLGKHLNQALRGNVWVL
jgi:hypothetical protein